MDSSRCKRDDMLAAEELLTFLCCIFAPYMWPFWLYGDMQCAELYLRGKESEEVGSGHGWEKTHVLKYMIRRDISARGVEALWNVYQRVLLTRL